MGSDHSDPVTQSTVDQSVGQKWCYHTICATERLPQCGDLRFKLPARGPGWSLAKEARTGDVRSGLFTTNGLKVYHVMYLYGVQ